MIARLATLCALGCSLFAAGASAKPLYLTVPRAYGTAEKPAIDVAFEAQGPVELRLLKPERLEDLVAAQADLRRAYVEPPSFQNPGRALTTGLNGLRSPGEYLLFSIGKEFRKELAEAVPPRSADKPRGMPRLAAGPERVVGIPPGMKLVHSEWLNLDLGGADRQFDVPGFGMWTGSSGYQERHVVLGPLPAGVYLVQVVQDRIEGQVVLVVTDLAVQVKQTDGKLLARVAGRDQRPREKASIQAWAGTGRKVASGQSDAKGEALLQVTEPKVLVTVTSGKDVALVDTDFYSTLAVTPDVFLYSDRPVYKPGDEVRFRGLLRKPDGVLARLFSPRQREVEVELISQEGRRLSTTTEVDEFGSFHGTLRAPADIGAGVLRIAANVDDRVHQGEARAQDYVKPTFYLELTAEGETVTPGGTLRARLRARRYAGGVPQGARYEAFLYRTQLDTPSWVDDAGLGGQGSAVTYGSASTTEGRLSIPERLFSTVEQRMRSRFEGDLPDDRRPDPANAWASAPQFDQNGEAVIEIAVPQLADGDDRLPWRYQLTVRAKDDQGTFANGASTLFLSPVEVMGSVRFAAPVARAGDRISLLVRATTLSGKPYGETQAQVKLTLRAPDGREQELSDSALRTAGDGVLRVPVEAQAAGTLLARVVLKDKKGAAWSGEAQAMVAGAEGEPIARVPALTLAALGGAVEPGDDAQLIALFPDGFGPDGKDSGPAWLTLSGTTLFSTRLLAVKGRTLIHRIPIERRFGSAVYASVAYATRDGRWEERSVAFRIVPAERTLRVEVQPLRAETQPLTEQAVSLRVTDSRGRAVRAQVSVGVVDKAVYAIQSEFRPRVLDFFYPVVRDNVASFSSSDFQGYGYGERLAQLMKLSPRYAFAAVKPPTRQANDKERDTAFWDAAVVTGEDGRATVRFLLPSNQTLWTVTAVAADAAGRFGESTAEFATRGELNVYAALPQFLREGDEAVGSVRLSTAGAAKSLRVGVAGSGAAAVVAADKSITVPAGGEALVDISITGREAGSAQLAIDVTGGRDPLRDRPKLLVRAGSIDETLEASRWGGGELKLDLPEGAVVESAELSLRATTVDAALASVRDLLVYPYGCVEQLIATSVPNVAVAALLQRMGALEKLDAESQALLAEARSRAVQGISRVLAMEAKGGGFGWYSNEQAQLPMTLIVLDGLAYAVEAGLADRNDPRLVESARWLESQEGLPFELEAARAYVLVRLDPEGQAPRVRALLSRAEPAGDLYPLALAVLAAEKAGVAAEPGVRDAVGRIVQLSRDNFITPALLTGPQPAVYWSWPVRQVGRMAVLGHAASLGGVDLGTARRRLVELLSAPELSTLEKSTALLHSLWLIERDAKELGALQPIEVEAPVKVELQPRGAGLFADLGKSAGPVRVGGFEGAAVLKARIRTPLRSVVARATNLSIERTYHVLREGGKVKLGAGDRVRVGEEIYVELQLDAGEGGRSQRSAYTVVEDAVPAGFAPLQEDKAFRSAPHALPLAPEALKRRIFSPERVSFFLEEPAWWSRKPRSVGYVMRAQFAGKFWAPPATVEDMYASSQRARTAAAVLEIAPAR